MASRRIEADVVVKVTGADDVADVAEQVQSLSDQTSSVRVEVEGEQQVKELQQAFKGLDNVTVTAAAKVANQADVQSFIKNVRSFDGETATAILAVRAAQAEAEVRDLITVIADVNSTPVDVKVATDALPAAKSDLDQLRQAIKDVDAETGGASEGLRKVGASGSDAGQLVGNAMGNSVQQVAELAGAGSEAGQVLGQMAELLGEAAGKGEGFGAAMASIGASLGPIAAITAAVALVTAGVAAFNAPAEAAAERTKKLGEAMNDSGDDALGFAKVLRDSGDEMEHFVSAANDPTGEFGVWIDDMMSRIPLVGGLFKDAGVNVFEAMSKAQLSIYDLAKALDEGGDATQAFKDQLQSAKDTGAISEEEFNATADALDKYGDAAKNAAKDAGLLNVSIDEANAMLTEAQDPLTRYQGLWQQLRNDIADGSVDWQTGADAINELSEKLGLTREEVVKLAQEDLTADMEAQADAAQEAAERQQGLVDALDEVGHAYSRAADLADVMTDALDKVNAASALDFSLMAEDTVQSFDDLKESLKEVKDLGSQPLVPTTVTDLRGVSDEAAAVTASLGGMRDAIQKELVYAMDQGGGSLADFASKAGFFRQQVLDQFPSYFQSLGLSSDEAAAKTQEVLSALGLLPEQVATQIRVTQEQEALKKLELFGSAIDDLPKDVQAKVIAAVEEGDPMRAWQLVQSTIAAQGAAEVPVNTVPGEDGATPAIEDVTGGQYDATVDVGADNKQGLAGVKEVETTAGKTKPVIDVAANIQAALITMAIINAIARAMAPTVPVYTDIGPAIGGLMIVAAQRPRVPVEAYLADYPTASEIAARIGRPRIPVDIVVGSSIRITGVRD